MQCRCKTLNDSRSLLGGDFPRGAGWDGHCTDPTRQLDWQAGHAARRGRHPGGERSRGREQPPRTPGAVEGLQREHRTQSATQLQGNAGTPAGEETRGSSFKPEVTVWSYHCSTAFVDGYTPTCVQGYTCQILTVWEHTDLSDLRMPGFWKLSPGRLY